MAIIKLKDPAFHGLRLGKGMGPNAFNIFQNEMTRFFNHFLEPGYQSPSAGVYPPVNIYQNRENFYVTAELPGLESDDINIEVEEDGLQIQGERKIEAESKGYYHRKERECGKFSRKITFQARIVTDKVTAEMADGVLKITLPKAEGEKPKKIPVIAG